MTGKLAIWQTAAQNEYGHFSARPHTKPPTGRSSRCITDMFFTEEEANAKSEPKGSPRSMLGNVIRTKPATKPSTHTAMICGIEIFSVFNGFSKSSGPYSLPGPGRSDTLWLLLFTASFAGS